LATRAGEQEQLGSARVRDDSALTAVVWKMRDLAGIGHDGGVAGLAGLAPNVVIPKALVVMGVTGRARVDEKRTPAEAALFIPGKIPLPFRIWLGG
jgi:hypothetical protein